MQLTRKKAQELKALDFQIKTQTEVAEKLNKLYDQARQEKTLLEHGTMSQLEKATEELDKLQQRRERILGISKARPRKQQKTQDLLF